jgi:flagellar biosynthesis chaperone FliJ
MAKAPKKGKKFQYNLATVLKVRNIFEKIEQEKFGKAQREHDEQVKKELEMKDYQKDMQKKLAGKLKGEIQDFANVLHRTEYLKKYKTDILEQEERTMEAEQKKEEQRERLIKAVKDRKILDKDK